MLHEIMVFILHNSKTRIYVADIQKSATITRHDTRRCCPSQYDKTEAATTLTSGNDSILVGYNYLARRLCQASYRLSTKV